MYLNEDQNYLNTSISKYELMLKSRNTYYFDASEFENIISHYFEIGKITKAKQAIKIALSQHPSSVNIQLFYIESLILDHKINEAESILEYLEKLEPHNEEILIQKGHLLSKKNKHEDAIALFKKAIELTDSTDIEADIYNYVGMEYLILENYTQALSCFKVCVEIDLEDYSALHNVLYCFDYLEQTQEAINYLKSYIDQNPYNEMAWHQLGLQYVLIKAYEKAINAFDYAIISDDTFVGAYLEKGKVLEQQKLYDKAIENYKITLALDDPTAFALLRIGYCYLKLNSTKKALTYFKQSVIEDPLLEKGWIAIVNYYFKKKNFNKALFYINKAIEVDADNSNFWKLYAKTNKIIGMFEQAEYGYKQALDLGNYELETLIDRADVLVFLGDYEAAAANLNQASEFYNEQAEIEYRLAGIYFTLQQTKKALFHLKKGLNISKELVFIITKLFPALTDHKDFKLMLNR